MVARSAATWSSSRSCMRAAPRSIPPGWTPLAYAATNGKTEVVRYLLDIGANPNALSPNGTTALMMAVRGGHAETVDLLLAKGADVNLRNQNGATALAWATRGGFDTIEKSLRQARRDQASYAVGRARVRSSIACACLAIACGAGCSLGLARSARGESGCSSAIAVAQRTKLTSTRSRFGQRIDDAH